MTTRWPKRHLQSCYCKTGVKAINPLPTSLFIFVFFKKTLMNNHPGSIVVAPQKPFLLPNNPTVPTLPPSLPSDTLPPLLSLSQLEAPEKDVESRRPPHPLRAFTPSNGHRQCLLQLPVPPPSYLSFPS